MKPSKVHFSTLLGCSLSGDGGVLAPHHPWYSFGDLFLVTRAISSRLLGKSWLCTTRWWICFSREVLGPCRPLGGIFSYPGGSDLSIHEYRSFLCSVSSISVTSSVPQLMVRSFVSLSERFVLKCRLDNSREVTLPVQQAPIGHLQALALGSVCGTEVETSQRSFRGGGHSL